jgi:alpha-L-fucosidase
MNGEAIYGTRPWRIFGEGPTAVVEGSFNDTNRAAFTGQDLRFTTKGNALYAITLAWPEKSLTIQSLASSSSAAEKGKVTGVSLLGHSGRLEWKQDKKGLVITMPEHRPGNFAFAFKIEGLNRAK